MCGVDPTLAESDPDSDLLVLENTYLARVKGSFDSLNQCRAVIFGRRGKAGKNGGSTMLADHFGSPGQLISHFAFTGRKLYIMKGDCPTPGPELDSARFYGLRLRFRPKLLTLTDSDSDSGFGSDPAPLRKMQQIPKFYVMYDFTLF